MYGANDDTNPTGLYKILKTKLSTGGLTNTYIKVETESIDLDDLKNVLNDKNM